MANDVNIDAITLEIKAEAEQASQGIEALISSLNKLETGIPGSYKRLEQFAKSASLLKDIFTQELADSMTATSDGIRGIADAARAIRSSDIKKIKAVADELKKAPEGVTLDFSRRTTQNFLPKSETSETNPAPKPPMKPKKSDGKKTEDEQKKLVKSAEKTEGAFSKLFASIKRVAVYRLIRTAMRELAQSLREGSEAFEQFDRNFNGGQYAKSIDEMRASLDGAKYSLGAVTQQIGAGLAPVAELVGNVFIRLVEPIQQFLRLLQGEKTYFAVDTEYLTEYNKQLKEAKRQLLGFDQINKLTNQGLDYSKLYKEKDNTALGALIGGAETVAIIAAATDGISKLFDKIKGGTSSVGSLTKAFLGKNSALAEQNALESTATESVGSLATAIKTAAVGVMVAVPIFKALSESFKGLQTDGDAVSGSDPLGEYADGLADNANKIESSVHKIKENLPELNKGADLGAAALITAGAIAYGFLNKGGGSSMGAAVKEFNAGGMGTAVFSAPAPMRKPIYTTSDITVNPETLYGNNGLNGNWVIQIVDNQGIVKSETTITAAERLNIRNGKTMIPLRG